MNTIPMSDTSVAFILPRTRILSDTNHVGMTDRQANLAFKLLLSENGKSLHDFCEQVNRHIAATKEIEDALHKQREILLGALWRNHPAAARRIMDGLAKREGGKP